MKKILRRFPYIAKALNESLADIWEKNNPTPSRNTRNMVQRHSTYEGADDEWFAKIDMAGRGGAWNYAFNAIYEAAQSGENKKIFLYNCSYGDYSMLCRECHSNFEKRKLFGGIPVICLDFRQAKSNAEYEMLCNKAKNMREKCIVIACDTELGEGLDFSNEGDQYRYEELLDAEVRSVTPKSGVVVIMEENSLSADYSGDEEELTANGTLEELDYGRNYPGRRSLVTEGKALTPEEKMDRWHNGTRKENIKACSDEKLKEYRKICKAKGYTEEVQQINAEIRRRKSL